jgi:hypothetical protein
VEKDATNCSSGANGAKKTSRKIRAPWDTGQDIGGSKRLSTLSGLDMFIWSKIGGAAVAIQTQCKLGPQTWIGDTNSRVS